jgi:hypothetical protein
MFIDYKKLSKQVVDDLTRNHSAISCIAEKVADRILEKFSTEPEHIKELFNSDTLCVSKTVYNNSSFAGGYSTVKVPLVEVLAEKAASMLEQDVYKLNKADILKQVHSEGIMNILHKKLEDQAKQHVLDFITKD